MLVDTPVQAGVSVNTLLTAKEQCIARQADWLTHYRQPVISLTLVTPGTVKDSTHYRNMVGVALQAYGQLLWKHRWQALGRQVLWLLTGPGALWYVARPANEIKATCSTLEQSHPLGCLRDIDVICPQNRQVRRQSLSEPQRRCLLYDELTHACARGHHHDTDLVVARIEQMIDAWLVHD